MLNCFTYNSDGAGFMYPRAGKVHIEKGFLTWEEFKTRYEKLQKEFSKATPFVFHFRIGTHGAQSAGMTHPFPIGQKKPDYTLLKNEAECAFVHNGIFSFLPSHKKYSDTVIFGKKIVEPLYADHPDTFIGNSAEEIISSLLGGSKLAFMRADGGIEYFGQWTDFEGCHYSNDSYLERIYTQYNSESYTDLFLQDDINGITSWFYTTEKSLYNKLVFIRPGDVWKIKGEKTEFDGFSFQDDPFPVVARIGNAIYQYDDASDIWDFIGLKEGQSHDYAV